ncbi:peptidylprolyl isomerase [Frondihabitans peucedani]|uniref:peptidylprolyl isomerase n=1 Tax=Frondihabitans peucedani TaxID=598626 RepID=UPI0031D96C19
MTPSKNQDRESRERLRRYTARQKVHEGQVRRRKRDNIAAVVAVVLIGALGTGSQIFYAHGGFNPQKPSASASASASATPSASATEGANTGDVPAASIAENRSWTGTMILNKNVRLGIELDGKKAPQATAVLVSLIEKGFYEGTHCWRMSNAPTAKFLQCGAAKADGTGDAGFQFGPLENVPSDNDYTTGVIAMARASSPSSQATQFFIVYGDTVLDGSTGGYTVVGKVTSGLSSLEKGITDKGLTAVNSANDGSPKVATTITAATIR